MIFGTMTANAQSLGDYARSARTTKAPQATASHHYDNDNMPRDTQLSIVGNEPAPAAAPAAAPAVHQVDSAQPDAAAAAPAAAETANAKAAKDSRDSKTVAQDRTKASDDLQKKIAEQKQKIQTLTQDLDLTQREYKLRSAAFYSDAGNRLRSAAQWDKDDAQYKQAIADKQKALDAARADLDTAQEAARKAGVPVKEDQ
jgi:hypothetical protein